MSKKSIIARQLKRERMVALHKDRRTALKKAGEWQKLAEMPRDGSPVRLKNRCKLTGRPRAYIRKFGLCRNMFRQMALEGKIPGVTKASW